MGKYWWDIISLLLCSIHAAQLEQITMHENSQLNKISQFSLCMQTPQTWKKNSYIFCTSY